MSTRSSTPIAALVLSLLLAPSLASQSLTPEQLEDIYRGPVQITIDGRKSCSPLSGPPYLPLVETEVNGEGPFPLLLDLGSNVVLLREDVARAADASFEIVREGADIARVETMRFGGLEARDILIGTYERLDVAGVISFHFFRDHAILLDFPAGRICVFDGPRPMEPGENVVVLVLEDRIPYVDVKVGEETFPMRL